MKLYAWNCLNLIKLIKSLMTCLEVKFYKKKLKRYKILTFFE